MVRVYRSDLEGFYEVSEERAKELEQVGYSRNPNVAPNAVSSGLANDSRTIAEGTSMAQALYSFLPDAVIDEFAKSWVKTGKADVAIGKITLVS